MSWNVAERTPLELSLVSSFVADGRHCPRLVRKFSEQGTQATWRRAESLGLNFTGKPAGAARANSLPCKRRQPTPGTVFAPARRRAKPTQWNRAERLAYARIWRHYRSPNHAHTFICALRGWPRARARHRILVWPSKLRADAIPANVCVLVNSDFKCFFFRRNGRTRSN